MAAVVVGMKVGGGGGEEILLSCPKHVVFVLFFLNIFSVVCSRQSMTHSICGTAYIVQSSDRDFYRISGLCCWILSNLLNAIRIKRAA